MIHTGPYARANASYHRLLGFSACHRLMPCLRGPADHARRSVKAKCVDPAASV